MLPILLLIIASLAFIWAFTIREPEGTTSQKHLQPLLPVLKRPEVAAFSQLSLFFFFTCTFYSFYSNFLKSLNFSTTEIGFLWAMGVVSEIVMFAYATTFLNIFLGVAL